MATAICGLAGGTEALAHPTGPAKGCGSTQQRQGAWGSGGFDLQLQILSVAGQDETASVVC
jgi:hypothetical protein